MKNVLVPMDGTKTAEDAIVYVQEVCSPGDRVVLLTVKRPEAPERAGSLPGRVIRGGFAGPSGGVSGVMRPDMPAYRETTDQVFQREVDEGRDYLEEWAAGLRQAGINVTTQVLINGQPSEAILGYARSMKPTFILMQRRTRFDLKQPFLGSVAKQVMESEVASVLLVPHVQAPVISA